MVKHVPLRVVICGAGARGREHVELIRQAPEVELVGVADLNAEALERLHLGPAVARSVNLTTLLDATQPDLVVLATPPSQRVGIVQDAVACGSTRAIVIEKPLALTLTDADRLLALCTERQVLPFVFHQLRWAPEFARLQERVTSGALGDVEFIEAWSFGKLFDQGSHLVDLITRLRPGHRIVRVSAQANDDLKALARVAPLPHDYVRDRRHPGAAWISTELEFEDGVRARIHCGLLAPKPRPELGPWLQKRVLVRGQRAIGEAHVAAHFSLTGLDGRLLETEASSPEQYQQSQLAVYAAISDALRNPSNVADDPLDRLVLEVLVACEESGRSGRPVELPLATDIDWTSPPRSPAPERVGPRISVILPIADHRGLAEEAVESWTRGQELSADEYELILVLDPTVEHLRSRLSALLREHDRIVAAEGIELEQYHLGACQASGDILLFTEPHCLAEPDTLTKLRDYFDSHDVDGVCARTIPICVNAMGRAESRMFESGFEEWSRPEHWVKVIIRGFGIRRASYEAIGGFQYEYDRFAEWLMAAHLRSRGFEMAYAPDVAVRHRYGDHFDLFDHDIREFTEGECRFRLETDAPAFAREFFGDPPELATALAIRHAPPARLLRPLARRIIGPRNEIGTSFTRLAAARELVAWSRRGLFADRRLVAQHWSAVKLAQLRYWLSFTDPQRVDAFRDYYMARTSLSRVQFALDQVDRCERVPRESSQIALVDCDERDLWGFYGPEAYQGVEFRWTRPLAAIRLRLEPCDYDLSIQLLGVRPVDPLHDLALYLDDQLLPSPSVDPASCTLQSRVPSELLHQDTEHWLALHCLRWEQPRVRAEDPRHLGLPVSTVTLTPLS